MAGTLSDWRLSKLYPADPVSYFALSEGEFRAFNITSGIITVPAGGGTAEVAALVNPVGSGHDAFVDLGEFGVSANTTFQRLRGTTITPTGTPRTAYNQGGGARTSVMQMYPAGTYTRAGGIVTKTAHIAAYQQYITVLKGRTVLRPGQSAAWTVGQQSGAAFTASIYFEYWELPAEV